VSAAELLSAIEGPGPFPLPNARILLLPVAPQPVPNDGIKLAYDVNHLSGLHALLSRRGHTGLPLRCVLTRSDWDLIHNDVASRLEKLWSLYPALAASYLRLLAKVHEQREWSDKHNLAPQNFRPSNAPLHFGQGDHIRG
jgi:hypothetical protein